MSSICSLCNKTLKLNGCLRHTKSCIKTLEKGDTPNYLISFSGDHHGNRYWIFLLVPADFSLEDVDSYLRDRWLECCNHLSCFNIDDIDYMSNTDFVDDETKDMNDTLSDTMTIKSAFEYEYDFGSSTTLIGFAHQKIDLKNDEIKLVCANIKPFIKCDVCEKDSTVVCRNCKKTYCDSCIKNKKHKCPKKYDEDDFNGNFILPVLNSPRFGVCDYNGEV